MTPDRDDDYGERPFVSVRHARRPWTGLALYGAVVVVTLAALTWGVPWALGRWA
jgi:hypothetical protein